MSDEANTQDQLYYLQCLSRGYVGNSPVFWRANGGYTTRVVEFRKFTLEEWQQIVRGSVGTHQWVAWPIHVINELAYLTIDSQDLPSVEQ